jgi:vacuolar-type H+-ATPase subunit B/Vma2
VIRPSAEVVGLVDRLEQVMIEAGDARKEHAARMRALNANYDATEEEFLTLFANFNRQQKERQERLLVIDQRERELTSGQEWKSLSRGVAHALDASAKADLGL